VANSAIHPLAVDKWVVSWTQAFAMRICVAPPGKCLRIKADRVLFAGNTVWTIPERFRGVREDSLYKSTLTLPLHYKSSPKRFPFEKRVHENVHVCPRIKMMIVVSPVAAVERQMGHMPPGAIRGGTEKGCSNFFATQNIQKLCELCWGRGWHERINHVRKTLHILSK